MRCGIDSALNNFVGRWVISSLSGLKAAVTVAFFTLVG